MSIQDEVKQGYYDTIVELYELDLTPLGITGTQKYYFTNGVDPTASSRKLRWRGDDKTSGFSIVDYEPLPIVATGFEKTTKGQIPTPELTVSNIFGTLSEAIEDLDDLIGAKLIRRRTFFKHLTNQSDVDYTEFFPNDVFYIERKTNENNLSVTFALASPLDLEGLQLPKRIVTQNYCVWKYRGTECGYNGGPVADPFNNVVSVSNPTAAEQAYMDAAEDVELRRRRLKQRVAEEAEAKTNKEQACDPNAVTIEERRSGYSGDDDETLLDVSEMSFAIDDTDGQFLLWGGANKTGDAEYRPSFKTFNTGFSNDDYSNTTGPIYEVINDYDGLFSGQREYDFPNTFALQPKNAEPVVVVDGQIIDPSRVGDGEDYNVGNERNSDGYRVFAIEKIEDGTLSCNDAETKYNDATADRQTAQTELDNAIDALNTANNNLPAGSSLRSADICGKQVSSCKLRFPDQPLPFGGFPGANLTR